MPTCNLAESPQGQAEWLLDPGSHLDHLSIEVLQPVDFVTFTAIGSQVGERKEKMVMVSSMCTVRVC